MTATKDRYVTPWLDMSAITVRYDCPSCGKACSEHISLAELGDLVDNGEMPLDCPHCGAAVTLRGMTLRTQTGGHRRDVTTLRALSGGCPGERHEGRYRCGSCRHVFSMPRTAPYMVCPYCAADIVKVID